MSTKLDQSLDNIVASTRRTSNKLRRKGPRRTAGAKPAATAPVGGVKKNVKPVQKKADKPIPTGPSKGESKIIISNLPGDVNEQQIKEYIKKAIGTVKRVMLVYGPNGNSRGIANVTFDKPDSASKAVSELNGVKVDNKPMKVEVVLDGRSAPAVQQQAQKLSDRITSNQKATPKSAAADPKKPKTAAEKRKAGRPKKAAGKAVARVGRPKKTAEDLDAEMVDYWGDGSAPAGDSSAPGEVAMTE